MTAFLYTLVIIGVLRGVVRLWVFADFGNRNKSLTPGGLAIKTFLGLSMTAWAAYLLVAN